MHEETGALLQLTRVKGLGPRRIKRLVDHCGSGAAVLDAPISEWAEALSYALDRAEKAKAESLAPAAAAWAEQEQQKVEAYGGHLLGLGTPDYPELLAEAIDPPPILWVRGELKAEDQVALAIVGARKCTGYGREQAERFGYHAADAMLTVVSGGAYGIDAAAHRGALKAGGRTVVVLGSAIDKPYPAEHAGLFDQIADGRGAVLSEWPMGTGPHHSHFLPRNRIIALLSLGTLVIEAAVRSGSLNTARRAVEEGRPAMYLPGRVDSQASSGCHHMIRSGEGELVHSIADVLETLGESVSLLQAARETHQNTATNEGGPPEDGPVSVCETESPLPGVPVPGADGTQLAIWSALAEPVWLDDLIQTTGLPAHQVQAALTVMEIRGQVKRVDGKCQRA